VAEANPKWQDKMTECSVNKNNKKGRQRSKVASVTQAKRRSGG